MTVVFYNGHCVGFRRFPYVLTIGADCKLTWGAKNMFVGQHFDKVRALHNSIIRVMVGRAIAPLSPPGSVPIVLAM